jgi:hypothetical protein
MLGGDDGGWSTRSRSRSSKGSEEAAKVDSYSSAVSNSWSFERFHIRRVGGAVSIASDGGRSKEAERR